MAVVLVACIGTVWAGVVTPPRAAAVRAHGYANEEVPVRLERGAELGRFNMGSTVIVLLGPEAGTGWDTALAPGARAHVGQALDRLEGTAGR